MIKDDSTRNLQMAVVSVSRACLCSH